MNLDLRGRFIICIYSDEIHKYVFHVFVIWGAQVFSLKVYCCFNLQLCYSYVCEYQLCPQTVHYDDIIMDTIASQITILTIVYSTVYSDADQR